MKILEAYHRLGLEDPSTFKGGIVDQAGNIRGGGKTTRIAIEMVLDICACKDPSTRFIILGSESECENLHSKALTFVNVLATSKLHYLLERRHRRTEDGLRGLFNCFVYRDPIDPRLCLKPPLGYARKVIQFEDSSCRVLDRDDIRLSEGSFEDFFSYIRLHGMCVDNVVTGDRIWSERYYWKA